MRLINADALKEMIPTTSVDMFENCRNCSLLSEEQVNELIDMTPTVNSWIPCSERLPEINDVVVIATVESNLDIGKRWIRTLCYDIHGIWCYTSGEPYDQIVLAWMPLPELYKGGE